MKTILIVGYKDSIAIPLTHKLETRGCVVIYASMYKEDIQKFKKTFGERHKILDFSQVEPAENLDSFADLGISPSINEIVQMDSVLRYTNGNKACMLLNTAIKLLDYYEYDLILSGRDNWLHLISLHYAKRKSIKWRCSTYSKIPAEMFIYTNNYYAEDFDELSTASQSDYRTAEVAVKDYRRQSLQIPRKESVKGVRSLINHAIAMASYMKYLKSREDSYTWYKARPRTAILFLQLKKLINLFLIQHRSLLRLLKIRIFEKKDHSFRYALFPLNRQPESSIDVQGYFFRDQISLAVQLSDSLPQGIELVVKLHPSDRAGRSLAQLKRLSKRKNIKIMNADFPMQEAIKNSELIFTIGGAVALESCLLKKPCLVFVDSYYRCLPNVLISKGLPKLVEQIKEAFSLDLNFLGYDGHVCETLAHIIANSVVGYPNRSAFGSDLNDDDLSNAADKIISIAES